jgi:hypothetical protein
MILTLKEYRERYSSLLSGCSTATIQQSGAIVSYISNIANAMEKSADGFDLTSIDGITVVNGKLDVFGAIDHTKVNMKLMQFFERTKDEKPELSDSNLVLIDEFAGKASKKESDLIEAKINDLLRLTQERSRVLLDAMSQLSSANLKKVELLVGSNGLKIKIRDSIVSAITKDRFFSLKGISGNRITLETQIFSLSYVDDEAKINKSIEMGPFEVRIDISDSCRIFVVKADACITAGGGYWHPHIDLIGNVCLGNGAASFAEAAKNFDISSMLQIIKAILHTYNSDSPYVSFDKFEDEFKKTEKRREVLLNEEALRKAFEEQEQEEWFDEEIVSIGAMV